MNTIEKFEDTYTHAKYVLRGPLNSTLKKKLKNKKSTILNNSDISRNLTILHLSKKNSEETKDILDRVKSVKSDIKLPAVQIAYVGNNLETNILTNSKRGTIIKVDNKSKYFRGIGKSIKFGKNKGYFLRKGVGAILVKQVIDEMREKGIKTIFVHPDNRKLEQYYAKFGFKLIPNVPRLLNRPKILCESHGYGKMMYLEL